MPDDSAADGPPHPLLSGRFPAMLGQMPLIGVVLGVVAMAGSGR